jgi:hypothetical protein
VQEEEGKALDVSRSQQHRPNTSGNALEWVLQKVDETLDDVEESPPAYATAIYKITTGPVGEAASKGASVAAKLTLQAGTTMVKAAVPVGKWVVAQGFKAAAGAVFKRVNKGKGNKGKE